MALGLLSRSGLPFILVGCKCDSHPAHREVDPAVVEKKAKTFLGEVDTFQTSEALPETHRRCLSVITRAVISSKRRECYPLPIMLIHPIVVCMHY